MQDNDFKELLQTTIAIKTPTTTPKATMTTNMRTENVNVEIKNNNNNNIQVNAKANLIASNKSTENKYLPAQLTAVSNERESKVFTTSEQQQQQNYYNYNFNKNTFDGNKKPAAKIENHIRYYNRKEYSREQQQQQQHQENYVQQGLQRELKLPQQFKVKYNNISLAEHKAQLRANFFLNNHHNNQKISTKSINNKSSEDNIVKPRNLCIDNQLQQQGTSYSYNKALTTLNYFPKVQELVQKFDKQQSKTQIINIYQKKMIVNNMTANDTTTIISTLKPDIMEQGQQMQHQPQQQLHSPLSDEGCNLAQSPYCSSDEDNESICTASTAIERPLKRKEKVARSASSDSALGLEVDEITVTSPNPETLTKRRMTLTVTDLPLRPALLPLAEPTALPDSAIPTELQQTLQTLMSQTAIPSKVLLEERVVELPIEPEPTSPSANSRRESAQSCISDYPLSECSGVRYMRTPSVVVSDYSDDVMCGITLEEIEYFRAQRAGRRYSSLDTTGTEKDGDLHSDVSAASSCSNLYYCGSTISALDGSECFVNGERMPLKRKSSDSSSYSMGGECDDIITTTATTITQETETDLSSLLAAQHLDSKAPIKKVGLTPMVVVSRAEN